jgi:hypothetical protein
MVNFGIIPLLIDCLRKHLESIKEGGDGENIVVLMGMLNSLLIITMAGGERYVSMSG